MLAGLRLLNARNLIEFRLGYGSTISVEYGTQFHGQSSDMKVSVHHASVLQREGVLDIYITLHLTPKVQVSTYDIAFDHSTFSYDNSSTALDAAFKRTVDADIIRRQDFTFNHSTCRNPADGIDIDNRVYFCHN